MTKSCVSMEHKVCPVCTNTILLNKRLANTLESQTLTQIENEQEVES